MATKITRTAMPEAGEHTDAKVKAFAEKWGYTLKDAERYLCQYALNRLAVLARNAAKKGKPEPKPRKKKEPKPAKTKTPKAEKKTSTEGK